MLQIIFCLLNTRLQVYLWGNNFPVWLIIQFFIRENFRHVKIWQPQNEVPAELAELIDYSFNYFYFLFYYL